MNMITTESDTNELKLFDRSRISKELLNNLPFFKALQFVETIVRNRYLAAKFSQTCVPSLRNEQLYDLLESRRHIPEIFSHLVFVLANINISLENFVNKWTSFKLGHRSRSSRDTIVFDRATIKGANETVGDEGSVARYTYFFFAKLLHELAHASLAELGRRLPSGDYDERFSSPATHAMTGEAGNAIERHFFGSVVDGIGRYVDADKSIYKLDYVILRERRNKQIIIAAYFHEFLQLKLETIESIPIPNTYNHPVFSKSSKRRRSLSPAMSIAHQDVSMTKNMSKKGITSVHRWGWGPEADETSDEEDGSVKTVFDCHGNPRPRCVLWKD